MNIDKRFFEGLSLFNEGKYYKCHDVLEKLWKETKGEYKDFYKGIIHSAVALYLLQQKRYPGAYKRFKSSICYLEKYKGKALGLDIKRFILDMKGYFSVFEKWDGKKEILLGKENFPRLSLERFC